MIENWLVKTSKQSRLEEEIFLHHRSDPRETQLHQELSIAISEPRAGTEQSVGFSPQSSEVLPEQICYGDDVCIAVLSLARSVHHSLPSLGDVASVQLSVEQSNSHVQRDGHSLVVTSYHQIGKYSGLYILFCSTRNFFRKFPSFSLTSKDK